MICPRCGARYRQDEAIECPDCHIPLADWDEITPNSTQPSSGEDVRPDNSKTVVNAPSAGKASNAHSIVATMPPKDVVLGCTVRAFRVGCLVFPILFLWIVYREVAPRPNSLHFYQISQFNPPSDALPDVLLPSVVGDYSLRGVGSNPYPNRSETREFMGIMFPTVALRGHYAHIAAEEQQSLDFYAAPLEDKDRADNFFDRVLARVRRLHAQPIQFHNGSGSVTHRQFLVADLPNDYIVVWRTNRWLFAIKAATRTTRNRFARSLSQQ